MSIPPTSSAAVSPAATIPSMAWETLATGVCWLEAYQVGDALQDLVAAKCFSAVEVATGNEVVIRGLRVTDDRRALAWQRLCVEGDVGWLRPLKVWESDGRRIEIMLAGPSVSLRDWGVDRRVTLAETHELVRQLAQALHALHSGGVVHLNLKPENVRVLDKNGPHVILGGLELATSFSSASAGAEGDYVVLHGNPFYAPPESVGLFKHPADHGLTAWDWWTLGRLVQELVLGRHVLGELLHRDVSRETEELQTRAEALLAEQEGMTRAGAVEHMPASVELEIVRLLRGLLASCRDGRWGYEDVRRWLAKEPVRDRYDLSRHDRLFERKEKLFTVPEAAELFGGAEAWDEGMENLFGRANPAGLRAFLAQNPAQTKAHEKLEAVLKLDETTALKNLPEDVRRELVACVAWAQLAEGIAPARWRGQLIDATVLRSWLNDGAQPAGAARVRGIINHVLSQAIGAGDAATGRWLSVYAHDFEAALAWTAARGQPVESPAMELALLRSLFEPEDALERTHEGMKRLYACSRDAEVDALFKKSVPTKYERALEVFTGTDAVRFGYVTHAQWREEQYEAFRARAQRMVDALYWVRLGCALRAGPVLFGGPIWLAILVTMPVGAAFYTGRWVDVVAWGVVPPVIVFVTRALWKTVKRAELLRRLAPGATWKFFDGARRCRREAERVLGSSEPVNARVLIKSLEEANGEIAKLGFEPARSPVMTAGKPSGTWLLALMSWVLLAAILGVSGVRVREGIVKKSTADSAVQPADKNGARQDTERRKVEPWEIKPKEAEAAKATPLIEDSKAVAPEETPQEMVKVAWPFKPTPGAVTVRVRGIVDATPEQIAVAEAREQELKRRYDEKTINVMVAVRVPTASGFGLMLYDGKAGKFTSQMVYEIPVSPIARTWLEIGGVRAFYLGAR
ncbi:MAG: hypothetical protein QM760_11660 [Nibricoccus sp.]